MLRIIYNRMNNFVNILWQFCVEKVRRLVMLQSLNLKQNKTKSAYELFGDNFIVFCNIAPEVYLKIKYDI